jgi:hypothetical protein
MADNSENIFVEHDYQNIIIVDPNKIVDQDGKAKDRLVNHEDLVMYANLECSLIPRTKLSLGIEQSEIKTIQLATINFLKPGNDKYMNDRYTELFTSNGTDSKQNKTYRFYEPDMKEVNDSIIETSLLGITNINYNINTSFLPKITMTLQDVRGRALFELGDKSPYAAFFNLPYPSFYLTLKGYYGKAVRYQLMLQNFNARFDNNSGNFEITLTFLTYKFNVLSDVFMSYLLATPYMYPTTVLQTTPKGNPNATTVPSTPKNYTLGYQKIKEVYNEYKSKGMISDDMPELTITQLQKRLDTFIKDTLKAWGEVNMEPLTNIEKYQKDLFKFKGEVFTIEDSWFKTNLDRGKTIILNDKIGTKVYTLKPGLMATRQKEEESRAKLFTIFGTYNKLLNENPTLGKGGNYTIGGKKENSEVNNKLEIGTGNNLPTWINFEVLPENVDYKKSYSATYNKNPDAPENSIDFSGFQTNLKTEISLIKTKLEQEKEQAQQNKTPPPYEKFYAFENKGNFLDRITQMEKSVLIKRNEITKKLGDELNKIIKEGSAGKSGLGFTPTIRNVLAVLFANGEAFLRLMDDCHREAWNKRDSDVRKKSILGSKVSSDSKNELIYPWPQFVVETIKDGVKTYDVQYPGDPSVSQQTEGYLFDEWPEIEFVEEFLGGLMKRDPMDSQFLPDDKEINTVNRLSLNAIEFPISNVIYQNKEEVKFFYEFWERMGSISNFSRINRGKYKSYSIQDIVAQEESTNMLNALGTENVFLIKKLKEYLINSQTIIPILKTISNQGEGESYQKFIRGYYSTPYITSYTNNDYKIFDNTIFTKLISAGQNDLKIENLKDLETHIASSEAEKPEFSDTFPITNENWIKEYMAEGKFFSNLVNKTNKVISYNDNIGAIANYDIEDETNLTKRPVTYFSYLESNIITNFNTPPINSNSIINFYSNRNSPDFNKKSTQLPTEGSVFYRNYSGALISEQTTSMLNTPYFINAIQKGVKNYKLNAIYPYKEAAYLFLNSLPLATLKEKYKSNVNGVTEDLDYIFASFKKFGAVHKIPYPYLLKYGSLWHRYKTKVTTNNDILDDVWTNFNYLENYDPSSSAATKTYVFTGQGQTSETRITLQTSDIVGNLTATNMNVGFYPKLINDFSFFLNGYEIFTSSVTAQTGPYAGFSVGFNNEDIQNGVNSGFTITRTSYSVAQQGSDKSNPNRTLLLNSYSSFVKNVDDTSFFILPSVGSTFNQAFNECYKNVATTTSSPEQIIEPTDNQSLYNGSVRTLWMAPNYGWFDANQIDKPEYNQYIKKIYNDIRAQDNFTFTKSAEYSYFDEITCAFKKQILDDMEQLFLNYSKSRYDFLPIDYTQLESNDLSPELVRIQNFHSMYTEMMRLPIDKLDKSVTDLQEAQYTNFRGLIQSFLQYDILFKYGNPGEYNKQLFLSVSKPQTRRLGVDSVADPSKFLPYTTYTPNALPTPTNNKTLAQTISQYPNAWESLLLNVGFSQADKIKYTDNGSTIFDFFIDNNIEFSVENIETLAPLIKIYASKKSNNPNYNKNTFDQDLIQFINSNNQFQDLVLNSTFTKLQKNLQNVSFTPQTNLSSVLIGNQGKVEIWESLKSTNDRWIAGYDLKYKTIFEDVLLIDRASRNIGDKVLVDIFSLNNLLTTINARSNLLYYIQSVLQLNHFQVMSLPAFVNFYNVQDPVKNAIPKIENSLEFANDMFGTHPNVDYRNSGPKMVCFYAGKPSEHPQINKPNYAFQDDGIYFQKLDSNTLIDNLVGKNDWGKSNRVVGFTVDMGIQNQNIFTNISLSQDNGKPTSETLQQLNDVANQAGGRKTSTQNVSLYNLYKTRSYGCSISMMGNAMIQPMMYFNLRHVPMFAGSYMILGVNHTITPGNFTTSFEGVRQSIFSLPDVDSYIQGIITNLVETVYTQVKQGAAGAGGSSSSPASQNTAQEKQNQQDAAKELSPSTSTICKPNTKFEKFEPIDAPISTTVPLKEMVDFITGQTSTITNQVIRTKLNYSIWCLFWINTQTSAGFKSFEYNFTNLRLNIKIAGQEKDFGARNTTLINNYFCATLGKEESAFARFGSTEDSIVFVLNYFKDKVDSNLYSRTDIKDNKNKIKDIQKLSEQMYRFLFTSWPFEDKTTNYEKDIFPTQECKNNIVDIQRAIKEAENLGL